MRRNGDAEIARIRSLVAVCRELGVTSLVYGDVSLALATLDAPHERAPAIDPYDRKVAAARRAHDTMFASSGTKPPFIPPPRDAA